jgi:hypothetical protein
MVLHQRKESLRTMAFTGITPSNDLRVTTIPARAENPFGKLSKTMGRWHASEFRARRFSPALPSAKKQKLSRDYRGDRIFCLFTSPAGTQIVFDIETQFSAGS